MEDSCRGGRLQKYKPRQLRRRRATYSLVYSSGLWGTRSELGWTDVCQRVRSVCGSQRKGPHVIQREGRAMFKCNSRVSSGLDPADDSP